MLLAAALLCTMVRPELRAKLAIFTLIRGGPSIHDYQMFLNSRACLQDVLLPANQSADFVAFHEGNVPADVQQALRHEM